jgi:hypothetical protein
VSDRVTFTKSSADRIAKVVRIVEAGDRSTGGLPTAPRLGGGLSNGVRFCSWSATWAHDDTLNIQFLQGGTATARNVILGVAPGNGWVARRGTAGYALVAFDLTQQPGYDADSIQLFGHTSDTAAIATWYSVVECATATT